MAVTVEEFVGKLGLKVDRASWDKGDKLVKGLKVAIAGFVGWKGLTAITGMVNSVAAAGDAAVKTSQKLGLGIEAVQELEYAAKQSGSSLDTLKLGMQQLAKGGVKDVEGELLKLADRFAAMPDGATKTKLALDKFGKSGVELIPMLNEGSAGIAALRARARELGIVIDGKTAKSMTKFGDDMADVKARLEGVKRSVVAAMLPALQRMLDGFGKWITANRELIAGALTKVVEGTAAAMSALASAVEYLAPVVQSVFEFLTSGSEDAKIVLIGIAGVITAVVVPALAKMAAGWIAALGPIGLIIAAVTAVVLLVRRLARTQAFKAVLGVLRAGFERVKSIVRAVWNTIKSVGRAVADTATWVWDKLVAAWRAVGDAIDRAIELAMRFAGQSDKAGVRAAIRNMGRAEERNVRNQSDEEAKRHRELQLWMDGFGPQPAWHKAAEERHRASIPRVSPSAMGTGAGGTQITAGDTNISVYAAPGMDEQKLAEKAGQEARKAIREEFGSIGHSEGVKR
jgi:hypothetical protein